MSAEAGIAPSPAALTPPPPAEAPAPPGGTRLSVSGLAWHHLWDRPLLALPSLLLLTLGFAVLTLALLVGGQIDRAVQRNLPGIDLVVGAKGSPTQIVLAGVYQLQPPTGQIPQEAVKRLRRHPLVAKVIPLSMQDKHRGHPIVGSTPDYLELYEAKMDVGQHWAAPGEVVLGSEVARRTGLRKGERFAATHGLAGDATTTHAEPQYTVVGVLEHTGSVLDRLILTSLDSVWAVHETGTGLDPAEELDPQYREALFAEREVTMLLVKYRSQQGAAVVPRWVQAQEGLQAAQPGPETERLLGLAGIGARVLHLFGAALLLSGALAIFGTLYYAVSDREREFAMLRMLGASASRVAGLVLAEAGWVALLGSLSGMLAGHGLTHLVGWLLHSDHSPPLSGVFFVADELLLPVLGALLALASAAWPAARAWRVDVLQLLQAPR